MRRDGSGASRPTAGRLGRRDRAAAGRRRPCGDRGGRRTRVYVLIRNTRDETVIGGDRPAVADVVRALRCPFLELPTVSTVHCEIGGLVEAEYRALHDVETAAPPRIAFYSGVSGRRYPVDRRSAAEAIAAQATQPIDFPATIENAYADGIGVFIEIGPGGSCTRLIGHILGDRPHVACSACRPDRDPFAAVLEVLADCIAHRLPVDLSSLYGATMRDGSRRGRGPLRADGPRRGRARRIPRSPVPSRPSTPPRLPRPRTRTTTNPWPRALASSVPIVRPAWLDLSGPLHDAERARAGGASARSCASPRARPI